MHFTGFKSSQCFSLQYCSLAPFSHVCSVMQSAERMQCFCIKIENSLLKLITNTPTQIHNTLNSVLQSWPVYEEVYNKMVELAAFLDLPRFPDITDNCFLHPNVLCMKYLMEANLPGKYFP